MAKGKAFLLKFSDGETPPNYQTVAGLRATEYDISANAVSVVATGIFLGSEAEAQAHAFSGTTQDCELSFEDGTRWRGRFLIQRLDYAGDFNGERNYTLQLESAGLVVPA